ncbi:putative ORFan [Tupanvirus deep ocean]|uniref:ORFan n=2 Tax=Tupanvirus TaxID=2094720 RepID=A0AC62A8F2_9VIRU|nr:putative ORFan [Tupanvirus deep ocean]QKU33942.1 putative ORFan [Tupanvirus deep ocean]
MKKNSIKETSDDIQIRNISHAIWLKTMEHCPKTVGHMKLLVSIVDRMGIFDKFDLSKTSEMDADKLNILYAVLRITNKVFNKYLDFVVRKIFRDGLQEIFECTHLTYYDLFFDQLSQDIDHFVCLTIKIDYPNISQESVKNKFIEYLRITFKKTFYVNIIKKLEYDVSDNFYEKYNNLFTQMAQEFITYTKEFLAETYETMKIFLDKIFEPQCSEEMQNDIINALNEHIDLKALFEENCMEIDIYCEQKLDDELEWTDSLSSENDKKYNTSEMNNILKDIGYQIHESKEPVPTSMTIFQPFIDHNFAKSADDLFEMLLKVLKNYGQENNIIDQHNKITLENYYALSMAILGTQMNSYDEFCDHLTNTQNFPENFPIDIVFRLLSRIFCVRIELFREDLCMLEFDNTIGESLDDPVIIFKKNNIYYTLCMVDCPFVPINYKAASRQQLINKTNNLCKINKKNNIFGNILSQYISHNQIVNV